MIKKILVTLDGSSYSNPAVEYSIWLARGFGAVLAGLHVVDLVALEGPFIHDLSGSLGFEPFLNFSTKMKEALEANGQRLLDSFQEDCKKAGIECTKELPFGIVSNEICERAHLADLVVVGRHGVNAMFEHGLLGSTTEGVIRKSPRPVFIVPETFSVPKNPLLCYDASPNSKKAMHSAAEFSRALSLPLTVISVSKGKEGDNVINEAREYLGPYGVNARFVRIDDEPPSGIERYYLENKCDLVFMGVTHHSRIAQMVLGSTTEHVMRRVGGPFFLER